MTVNVFVLYYVFRMFQERATHISCISQFIYFRILLGFVFCRIYLNIAIFSCEPEPPFFFYDSNHLKVISSDVQIHVNMSLNSKLSKIIISFVSL